MSSSPPSVRHHLTQQQRRAVSSFIADPSRSNWDELVKSMKRQVKTEEDVNGGAGDANAEDLTRLSLEKAETSVPLPAQLEQIHSTNNHVANNCSSDENDVAKTSPSHELVEDFAVEHGIFLRAVLQLLHEKEQPMQRQQSFPDEKFDDIQNVIKIGSLKKASRRVKGVWNVKYVEIRKGFFSYYGDHALSSSKQSRRLSAPSLRSSNNNSEPPPLNNNSHLARKDIPLHALECTCRAVRLRSVTSPGAVFELRRRGRRHLLMANTKEERQYWIQAIHDAMIGASVTRSDNFFEYHENDYDEDARGKSINGKVDVPMKSPYGGMMSKYLNVRNAVMCAQSKSEYTDALGGLNGDEGTTVPVEWIKAQFDNTMKSAFVENETSSCVEQLWKDLCRDSVEINGNVLVGDAYHGPDRILGKLTRQILHEGGKGYRSSYGKGASDLYATPSLPANQITEAQAVLYARDILLASDRTRSGGDSYYCAEHLCLNRALVAICPTSVEAKPLSITVGAAGLENSDHANVANDFVYGWVSVRTPNKQWMRRFLILGQHVLSCYAEAEPRPHKLKEKVFLKGAVIVDSLSSRSSQSREEQSEILQFSILTSDKKVRREFLFDDESSFSLWRYAFENAAQSTLEDSIVKSINVNEIDFREELQASSLLDESRNAGYNSSAPKALLRNTPPSVDVEINVSAEYKVVTVDPQGDDADDTWAIIRTTFIQKFRLSGGSRGRISRGDEVVMIELM